MGVFMSRDYIREIVFPLKITRKEKELLIEESLKTNKSKAELIREGLLSILR